MGTSRTNRIALTVVELVTVIAIASVVLAIMVPVLGETRRRGKDTVCIQNLHRIAQASHVYSSRDPTEQAVPIAPAVMDASRISDIASYSWGGKSGLGRNGSILTSAFGPANGMAAADRPLNHILLRKNIPSVPPRAGGGGVRWRPDANLDLDVFRCPADSGYTGMHAAAGFDASPLTSFDFFGVSYAIHTLLVLFNSDDQPCEFASNTPLLHSLSSIVNPDRTILFQENNGRDAWRAFPVTPNCIITFDGEAKGWHGKPWNFHTAFVDGSVRPIHMRGFRAEPVAHSPVGTQAIVCITIRGKGWQIDTLPTPLVRTGLSCTR